MCVFTAFFIFFSFFLLLLLLLFLPFFFLREKESMELVGWRWGGEGLRGGRERKP